MILFLSLIKLKSDNREYDNVFNAPDCQREKYERYFSAWIKAYTCYSTKLISQRIPVIVIGIVDRLGNTP